MSEPEGFCRCGKVGLRKVYVLAKRETVYYCAKHTDEAFAAAAVNNSIAQVRREFDRDERMHNLALENNLQGTIGQKNRRQSTY